MRFGFLTILGILISGPALAAPADDAVWINQCTLDNKDEGATEEVVLKYCTCMNDQMDENEDASISEWEKSHPDERKACETTAGWR